MIDKLSFGHKPGSILPSHNAVPAWKLIGQDYTPEVLSDRVILTPPYPGNKRGAIWTEDKLQDVEWEANLYFRASGPERGGGNLQLWYAKDGANQIGTSSLYTVDKFDGLVIVVDQYGGRGGTIRGFLDDGSKSYKGTTTVDTLSFGQCDYPYRNQGRFSVLTLKQTPNDFEVLIDQRPCFKSSKILLPPGYQFGITAASPENPDSFEVMQFTTSTTVSAAQKQAQGGMNSPDQQKLQDQFRQQQQQQQGQGGEAQPGNAVPPPVNSFKTMPDVLAESIKDQQQQFADLHNRIQVLSHQSDNMFRELAELGKKQQERQVEIMNRAIPTHDNTLTMLQTLNRIERTLTDLQKAVDGKDFGERLAQLHNVITQSQSTLMEGLPQHMSSSEYYNITFYYARRANECTQL